MSRLRRTGPHDIPLHLAPPAMLRLHVRLIADIHHTDDIAGSMTLPRGIPCYPTEPTKFKVPILMVCEESREGWLFQEHQEIWGSFSYPQNGWLGSKERDIMKDYDARICQWYAKSSWKIFFQLRVKWWVKFQQVQIRDGGDFS